MSSQLIVLVTNDQQPGYKRLYFMQKGKMLIARPSFAKVRSADIEAGLWTFALNRTGSPEYLLVDLTKKTKLF
ncbi:MAG: hypothetical protein NMNS01_28410 [Nitrosomonas sp.]|nr:MAG: hypothetical protein NMNS01_28410 [Nitrosomonas sp.]